MDEIMKVVAELGNFESPSYGDVIEWWNSHAFNNVGDYDPLLSNFAIIFACNSANIENINVTYHATRELFDNGKCINFTGDISHALEIINQKKAYNFILKSLENKTEISIDFIKSIHEILLSGCYDEIKWSRGERPGTFRIGEYTVGTSEMKVLSKDIESEMIDLVNDLNSNKYDVLKSAALFHLMFEYIHPFADGNGRVGRFLTNYFLMLNEHPPIVIFDEDKGMYYKALEVFDKSHKYEGFIEFLKESTVKTWSDRVVMSGRVSK